MGNGGITPLILNLGVRWELSDQIHSPAALPAGREALWDWVRPWAGPDLLQKKNRFAPS